MIYTLNSKRDNRFIRSANPNSLKLNVWALVSRRPPIQSITCNTNTVSQTVLLLVRTMCTLQIMQWFESIRVGRRYHLSLTDIVCECNYNRRGANVTVCCLIVRRCKKQKQGIRQQLGLNKNRIKCHKGRVPPISDNGFCSCSLHLIHLSATLLVTQTSGRETPFLLTSKSNSLSR